VERIFHPKTPTGQVAHILSYILFVMKMV